MEGNIVVEEDIQDENTVNRSHTEMLTCEKGQLLGRETAKKWTSKYLMFFLILLFLLLHWRLLQCSIKYLFMNWWSIAKKLFSVIFIFSLFMITETKDDFLSDSIIFTLITVA